MAVAIVKPTSATIRCDRVSDVSVVLDHNGYITVEQDGDVLGMGVEEAETLYEVLGLLLNR